MLLRTITFRVRAGRALHSARKLDEVIDQQTALLGQLPEEARGRTVEHVAELVMLAQAYRHFAAGWISYRELQRRGRDSVARLDAIKGLSQQQLTERA